MSKIRIYELAKELGVDNRVIITKANDLGMEGKSSHSHSLDSDEADQIRRAIIRQAVGAPAAGDAKQPPGFAKEGLSVERIKAGVIRRRKEEPRAAGSAEVVEAGGEISSSQESVSEEAAPEVGVTNGAHHAVEADSLESVPAVASEGAPDVPEAAGDVVVASEAPSPVTEVAPAPAAVAAVTPTAAVPAAGPAKKVIGPKILGKIELAPPTPKRPARTEPRWSGTSNAAPATEPGKSAGDGKGGGDWARSKRTKRREFSRTQLVDYEGMEPRRGGRGHKKHRDDGSLGAEALEDQSKKAATKRPIKIGDAITVGELAKAMSLKSGEVIAKFMELGVMATINQAVDHDTATVIAQEFGYEVESVRFDEESFKDAPESGVEEDASNLFGRPPVVTVMGHVDHGKTTLLDSIRNTAVVQGEAGGITQHIGAYVVDVHDGKTVTFIDTPGHAAFTAMRSRGANVTDIVVLVVAADDGVMPQTLEALNHAKAAEVPVIVAVNKMDKPDANPDRIRQQLSEHGLVPEAWGGETMYIPVSALKRDGIKELLEAILLVAEVEDLKANPARRGRGVVIESRQDKGRGVVATVLVQNGTLRIGDAFVSGVECGRVRSMIDHLGAKIEEAGPSTPIEITGFDGAVLAGDDFFVAESDQDARQVAENRRQKKIQKDQRTLGGPLSLEEFARRANNMTMLELNVIVKADVQGSLEAIREALEKLTTDKVRVRVVHAAVGGVNESDVQLAIASKGVVIGFGVRAEPRAASEAEVAGVEIRFYRIIYELLDDVKKAMTGLLAPVKKESNLGRVEVRQTFSVPKAGVIAGCYVLDGVVKRNALVRVLRDSRVIHEGKMSSLRRFKDDVSEVQSGFECGIGLDKFNDVRPGDIYEVYEVQEVAATL